MYRIPRGTAEDLPQLLRGNDGKLQLPLAAGRFDRRRPSRPKPQLLDLLLPLQRRELRRAKRRQASSRLLVGFVLFHFHIASPVLLYERRLRNMTVRRP